jgi:hypothetical protein
MDPRVENIAESGEGFSVSAERRSASVDRILEPPRGSSWKLQGSRERNLALGREQIGEYGAVEAEE